MTTLSDVIQKLPTDVRRKVLETPHQRARDGVLAKFLHLVLPKDPGAVMVFPLLAEVELKEHKISRWRLLPIAILMLALTIGLITLLLRVPGLHYSVVGLLTLGFGRLVSHSLAVGLAWGVGMYAVIKLGSFVKHSALQRELDNVPASKNGFYNFWLKLALWEEMIFRAGCEKWTWAERIRASFIFGTVHIINIWYSFAAGIALSLTGFAFLLVYLWDYRRTKSQVSATAISGTVHAMYNTFVMVVIIGVLVVWPLAELIVAQFV